MQVLRILRNIGLTYSLTFMVLGMQLYFKTQFLNHVKTVSMGC